MLQKVREQRPSYNNSGRIASSVAVSSAKLLYYQHFAALYSFVGSFADSVVVNSSWTLGHIAELWRLEPSLGQGDSAKKPPPPTKRRLVLIYPPCNTAALSELEMKHSKADVGGALRRVVISIGQFRPEKDHFLQLRSGHLSLRACPCVPLSCLPCSFFNSDGRAFKELKSLDPL